MQLLADPVRDRRDRNAGSGTRILIDRLLRGEKPPGYSVQAKSHNAVAAAIAQQRADWGLAIDTVAQKYDLGFIPYQSEQYDFVIPESRKQRPAVQAFLTLLSDPTMRAELNDTGFKTS